MTLIGSFWLIFCIYAACNGKKHLITALVLSAAFQATSFVNIGDKGVSLFLVTEVIIILRYLPYILTRRMNATSMWLVYFFIYSTAISLVSPFLFSDVIIINDDYSALDGGGHVSLGASTFVYIAFLLLNILTAISLSKSKPIVSSSEIIKILVNCAVVVSIFGFVEMYMKITGTYGVLSDYIFNNAGYKQALFADASGRFRLQGGFSEPSYCGAFLSAAFWMAYSRRNYFCLTIIGIALALNFSGTGVVGFAVGLMLNIVRIMGNKRQAIVFFTLGLVFIILMFVTGLAQIVMQHLTDYITDKATSDSGNVRSTEMVIIMQSILSTFGIGIGLGATRGGGFILNLIASTGIVGIFTFSMFVLSALRGKGKSERNYIYILLASMAVAIPDLSYPVMWASLLAISISTTLPESSGDKRRNLIAQVYRSNNYRQ
ncbi:hypothetical protein [Enterobacter hormaechei]|uniref:hypothetical protein n=1 Tax=Enterobacter hormaechei TaxID=158836 RepID=UPI0007B341FF|nr:hypothetical protein [Enterobacter hormaechei]KZP81181.1 hypothetical protein A3N41_03215 [Enterobacter hormaechei subsp. steigerwaltii]MCC2017963.1 hypothetical protein [Enterobacter hormaechei]